MPKCKDETVEFGRVGRRVVQAAFDGGDIVSDGGVLMQTAVGRAEPLGSAPTLSRLETAATLEHTAALHEVPMQQFVAGHAKAPKELVLDVDATHVPLHGARS